MFDAMGGRMVAGSHNLMRRSRAELDTRVLEVVKNANQPIGAYEIANRLNASGYPTVANQVYRVLHRLMASGHVRRIASLAAFIAEPGPNTNLICICDICHTAHLISLPQLSDHLQTAAANSSFRVSQIIAEVKGKCTACRNKQERK